jgi:murein DD-endopeptidase MepM/ murein hydrolase activator NlpD
MNEQWRKVKRTVIAGYLIVLHLAFGFFAFRYFYPDFHIFTYPSVANIEGPDISTPVPTPLPVPSEFADQLSPPVHPTIQPQSIPSDVLMIPVKGVKRGALVDTYTSARSNGRQHDAIDIIAAAGTPVVAAADGEILKFFDSEAGGITIYQLSSDKRYIFYYAHLQRRADDLHEHDSVRRGDVIAYVGDTGNAGPGNYHLHFAIAIAADTRHFWSGVYINPYPLLLNGIESP